MKNRIFIVFISLITTIFSQEYKPFQGKLIYKVDLYDSLNKNLLETKFVTTYTNDTLIRVESETNQLGSQVMIKHLTLNKYYLLLEINNQKYAIQHQAKEDTTESKYDFQKSWRRINVLNKLARRTLVSSNSPYFTEKIGMYYYEDISPKYVEAMKGIPGLPVDYYLFTEQGVYHYKLIEFKEEFIPKEAFGIPTNFKKVSFDEFIGEMMEKKPNE
jgi:hypothetical protein